MSLADASGSTVTGGVKDYDAKIHGEVILSLFKLGPAAKAFGKDNQAFRRRHREQLRHCFGCTRLA